jgi:hypothetical protein
VLLVWVALCFNYYLYTQFKLELQITQNIELANWKKLNQLESNIHANLKKYYSNHKKILDLAEEQVCTPVPSNSEF